MREMLRGLKRGRQATHWFYPDINPRPQPPVRIGVVVTCHEPYLKFLPDCLGSIDAQSRPADAKCAVFDGCDPPAWLDARPDWIALTGTWGTPNPARNLGLARLRDTMTWLVWFDADNTMPPDALAVYAQAAAVADRRVAVLYPDLQYADANLSPTRLVSTGDFDYWRLRFKNFCDTSSCWRRQAVESVGGWVDGVVNGDDYALAHRLTRQGWIMRHLPEVRTNMREHELPRRSEPLWLGMDAPTGLLQAQWQARSHAIVTLLAGRADLLDGWLAWLRDADLPDHTQLYAVDNSRDPAFHELLAAVRWPEKFDAVTVIRSNAEPRSADRLSILAHVARLYNDVLARVPDLDIVATMEDDVLPPLDAFRMLYAAINYKDSHVAVSGAVYPSPEDPTLACLSLDWARWTDPPLLSKVKKVAQQVGMVGAGFTLYAGWMLAEVLPVVVDEVDWLGWDAVVCREARQRGYEVVADGRVRAKHFSGLAGGV